MIEICFAFLNWKTLRFLTESSLTKEKTASAVCVMVQIIGFVWCLLLFKTLRPFFVDIRFLKPCSFADAL